MQHLCGQASFKILHSAGLLHLNHRTGIVWHCGMHCNWTTYVPNCEFMCCGKFWIHTVTNQHLINSATCSFNGKWISNWDNNLSNCDMLRCAGYAEVSRVLANNWLALPTFKVCVSQTENYAVLQEHKINARWANLPFFSTRSELKLSMLRSVHFWELEAFFPFYCSACMEINFLSNCINA